MQQTRDIILYDVMEVNDNEDNIEESFESDDEVLSDYDSSETSLAPNDSTSQVSTNSTSVSHTSKTSSIWEFFDKNSNTGKPKCRVCKMEFSKKFSTSTLQRHLQRQHLEKANQLRQRKLQFSSSNPYNESDQRERDDLLLTWVACTQQAFRVVDNKHFRAMIKKLDSRYLIPNREKVRTLIIEQFEKRRQQLVNDLAKLPGKVALTTDM